MRRLILVSALVLIAILGAAAQEGHPLSGTWTGDWGSTPSSRNHLTVVLSWDGKEITGILNPGPDSAKLTGVYLDPATWTVRFEADAKDAKGAAVRVSAEGKIENLGSIHRTLKGTWQQGPAKGDFKLTRD